MQLFYGKYTPDKDIVQLDADEAKHCIKVLRKKRGDEIEVVDGKGNWFSCEITHPDVKAFEAKIKERKPGYGKRDFKLSIAIAPPKNIARFEWFLEKATEIGIDEIIPLLASRSERTKLKMDRLENILVSAMKQSGKAFLPELSDIKPFKALLDFGNEKQVSKFIATCSEEKLKHLKDVYKKDSDALILIGPEGDFTNEEVEQAIKNGFQPVSLGNSRLRVETAGLAACHTINLVNEN